MCYLIARHAKALKPAIKVARDIHAGQKKLHAFMDDLCRQTCPWCPSPCCMSATVWIDFRDLLYLHLSGLPLPDKQLLNERGATCRHLGIRGCRLPRQSRPWTCTCYLCPTQRNIIRKRGEAFRTSIDETIQAVKIGRKQLEAAFMRVILPNSQILAIKSDSNSIRHCQK